MIELTPRACDVDSCHEAIRLIMVDSVGHIWRVIHGEGEASRDYDAQELFVDGGYQAWVREVHAYEREGRDA